MPVLFTTHFRATSLAVLAIAVAGACLLPSSVRADAEASIDNQSDQSRIDTLVEQLGADSFHVREQAMSELVKIGPPAEAAVQEAYDSVDPEVAYRARKIIKEIDRSLIAQRRAAFLEGDVEVLKTNAESWKRLEAMLGNSRKTRELFVQMQTAAEDLLTIAEKDPKGCAQEISQLYTQDQQARRFGGQGLPSGVVAAMVFIGNDDRVTLDASAMSRCTSLLYRHRGTLGENDQFRNLLGGWVKSKATGSQQYQLLRLAQQFKLDEGIELAREMVEGAGHNSYKAHAILTIGMMGKKEDVELLKKLVNNDTKVGTVARSGNKRIECRLGDVALGMALALSDQNAKEYGFSNAPNGRPTSSSYYNYGFVDDKSRKAAREKWNEYVEQQAQAEEK